MPKNKNSRPTSDAKIAEPVAAPAVGRVTKENHGEWVDPAQLREHARNGVYFTMGSAEDLEALGEDLKNNGFKEPVIVTDTTCESGADVVLRGWRRATAAVLMGIEVPVVRASGLTAKQEEQVLVRDNLSDLHRRKYSPSQRARLSRGLKDNFADLALGVEINPGGPKPRQNDVIAKKLGEHPNALKDLATIFETVYATPKLHKAVDAGQMSVSAAATLVRAVGRTPNLAKAAAKISAGTADDESARIIAEAQTALDKELAEMLAERAAPRPKAKPTGSTEAATSPVTDPPTASPAPPNGPAPIDEAMTWAEQTTTEPAARVTSGDVTPTIGGVEPEPLAAVGAEPGESDVAKDMTDDAAAEASPARASVQWKPMAVTTGGEYVAEFEIGGARYTIHLRAVPGSGFETAVEAMV